MKFRQQIKQIRPETVIDRSFVYAIYWFFAVAPFITAIPLFFLMPESLPSRVYPFVEKELPGSRWELFLIPAAWFVANVVLHYVFYFIERSHDKMPTHIAILRVLTSVIFAALAIIMELFVYQTAMISL